MACRSVSSTHSSPGADARVEVSSHDNLSSPLPALISDVLQPIVKGLDFVCRFVFGVRGMDIYQGDFFDSLAFSKIQVHSHHSGAAVPHVPWHDGLGHSCLNPCVVRFGSQGYGYAPSSSVACGLLQSMMEEVDSLNFDNAT
jgi:hypothetical protein